MHAAGRQMAELDHTDSVPQGPAVCALIKALRALAAQMGGSIPRRDRAATLREPIIAAVDELKRAGLSATEVVFSIAALVARADVAASSDTLDALTAWSVDRYFDRERVHRPEA
jgi:hypothetical protein